MNLYKYVYESNIGLGVFALELELISFLLIMFIWSIIDLILFIYCNLICQNGYDIGLGVELAEGPGWSGLPGKSSGSDLVHPNKNRKIIPTVIFAF